MNKSFKLLLVLSMLINLFSNIKINANEEIDGLQVGSIIYDYDENGNMIERVVEESEDSYHVSLMDEVESYYEVVSIDESGNETVIEKYEKIEDSQTKYNEIILENPNINYAIKYNNNYVQIKYAVVQFKRIQKNGVISTTNYTEYGTGNSGYLHVDYGVDAAYIDTIGNKVRFKIAGVIGLVNADLVDIVPYSENNTYINYYYVNENNNLMHGIRSKSVKSDGSYPSKIWMGYAPSYLQQNEYYYSYDAHYFYTDYFKMIDDYRNNTYENAINPNEPYYNYYQYLSFHSQSHLTSSEIDQYISSKYNSKPTSNNYSDLKSNQSVLVGEASSFYKGNELGVNPILTMGVALNESGWGRSKLSVTKNNIFGLNAVDSSAQESANAYNSVAQCIEVFMQQYITHGYLDTKNDSRYLGAHLGDKASGMNVMYASDPYWGEKAASNAYYMDSYFGRKDTQNYKLGIKESSNVVQVYKETDTKSEVIYKMQNTYSSRNISYMPVLILDTIDVNGVIWYKIQSDHPLDENQNRIIRGTQTLSWLYKQVYNFKQSYGYVEADKITSVPTIKLLTLKPDKNMIQINEKINMNGSIINGEQEKITYKSSDTSIATIDSNGIVTGIKPGTVKIEGVTESGLKSSYTLKVIIPIEKIELSKTNIEMILGSTQTLEVSILPENATESKVVTWTSSDSSIVSVDNGKLTALKEGEADIVASLTNGMKATCHVIVKDNEITSITLDKTKIEMYINQNEALTATIIPENTTQSKEITWTSSDNSIVSVNNGIISALKAGSATISATSSNGLTATCQVIVKDDSITSIKFDKETVELKVDESIELNVTFNPTDTTQSKDLVWTSSNPKVATVENGKITALKSGIVTISATTTNGISTSCKVIINKIERIYGDTRYQTALNTADALKNELGVDKFDTVIVATGVDYPDALAGSYLAGIYNAPILMVNERYMDDVVNYIKNNVNKGSTVFILGGENAVSPVLETKLEGYNIDRLAGANRFETNLLILNKAGVTTEDILVCTGYDYADSLSASATQKPILLVHPKAGLNDKQKEFLNSVKGNDMYVIGGTSAISKEIYTSLQEYASKLERIGGATRNETSVLIAQQFFTNPTNSVLAYSRGFADGLAGGPLAIAKNAPLILTQSNSTSAASEYIRQNNIKSGSILGGPTLISDEAVQEIFNIK